MRFFFVLLVLSIIGKCSSRSEETFSVDYLLTPFDKKVESIASPSAEPTAEPTFAPTNPTVAPTMNPTAPTVEPTLAPTNSPTNVPTLSPSTAPTTKPTAPTVTPTETPTRAPTVNNAIVFVAETVLQGFSPEQYESNKKACNETIQEAASSVMPGTSKNDIQDIVVTGTGSRTNRGLAGSSSNVKFTVRTFLTGATYQSLSSKLAEAAVTGTFTAQVQYFATQLNVPVLQNATVDALTTENELVGREGSKKLTGTMVAGLVIGIILCLGFLALVVYFFYLQFPSSASPDGGAAEANETPNGVESSEVADVESPRAVENQI